MIFREPMTAPDPVYTIGGRIAETVMRHEGCSGSAGLARAQAARKFVRVGFEAARAAAAIA
jgi:peptide/nickel transport system ATP-binding protein